MKQIISTGFCEEVVKLKSGWESCHKRGRGTGQHLTGQGLSTPRQTAVAGQTSAEMRRKCKRQNKVEDLDKGDTKWGDT